MNSEWLDYNCETNGMFLRSFLQGYDYDISNSEEFQINYNNEGIYRCKLKTSKCFKGLVYMVGVNVDTGESCNFAVGDDNIVSWLPPHHEPDLMVG